MFGIGLAELAVIAFVGVVVFGPERLPEFARQAGAVARKATRMARSARDGLREELGDDYADLELRDLDPRAIVGRHIADALADDDEGGGNGRARADGAERDI